MKTSVLVTMMVLCFSVSGFAYTLSSEEEVRRFADNVVETAVVEGIVAAFDKMKPYVQMAEEEVTSAAMDSKEQRDQFFDRFGRSVNYEFIGKKKIGTSLIRLQYLEKTERHAFPWSFYFYRTRQGWSLNYFYWHSNIRQLFSDSMPVSSAEQTEVEP